ncbi:hypothetical protein DWU98_09305 [Dyella monticola]|uniref:Uncharacterized protein n=1 Tax=Dyella monticola TaxID=1927958 RepID=A0A370X1D7_9GAMM|nr:hypothetical protein [Dyella monticola]RDS82224.1 hypothetical protein DWU98_09305 [Dyella monticola]
MVKHVEAVYYEDGVRHPILAKDLIKDEVLALARTKALVDSGDEFALFVRGGKTPHFYATSKGRQLTEKPESSEEHNRRIESLLMELDALTKSGVAVEVGTTVIRSDVWQATQRVEHDWQTIGELRGYTWAGEVTRALSDGQKCRHDLFGANQALLNLTDRNPWVAIEVIHTHYPSEASFKGFLDISSRLPLIVLFDAVEAEDYLLRIGDVQVLDDPPSDFKPSNVLWTVKGIRSIVYIHQGQVRMNGRVARVKVKKDNKDIWKDVETSNELKQVIKEVLAKRKKKSR